MDTERYSRDLWRRQYTPVGDWDKTFRDGLWDRLGDLRESVRHAVIAGYIHKLVPRGHILDAGCGEGVLIDYLDLGRLDYTGFDVSPTAIERARARYPAQRLLSCSIEDFEPPLGIKYDQVVFNDSLASLDGPMEMIDRYQSFLRPAGHIVVSQFQPPDPTANGALFTRLFEAEIAAGRYTVAVKAEVQNLGTGGRWRSYCLSPA